MIPRKPPIAEPNAMPTRFGSYCESSPASSSACRPASTASKTLRSSRRASFGETISGGSKPLTSAATRTGNSLASKDWMKSIPLSPASAALHVEGVSSPSGLTVPIPVITTRRIGQA